MINRGSLRSLPYILATGVTVSLAAAPAAADGHLTATAPKGASVWIAPSGDTYQLLRLWRSGDRLRLYRDEGNYPGDGVYCAWGSLDGKRFTGKGQRVASARAMAVTTDVVMLDEPMAGIDEMSAQRVRALLRERLAASGATAVLVTHDPVDAEELADATVLIRHGRVHEPHP